MSLDLSILNSYRDYMGEDADVFIQDILDTFYISAPQLVTTLEESLANNNVDTFVRAAHTLKSNSATVGAAALTALCADLEQAGKAGNLEALTGKVSQTKDELAHVITLLKN
jgi:HPt (histidine-containing phosphotransfer) domain-containing protein